MDRNQSRWQLESEATEKVAAAVALVEEGLAVAGPEDFGGVFGHGLMIAGVRNEAGSY